MPRPLRVPPLRPGQLVRTRDLARWSSNPTRLAAHLVERGRLQRLRHGLYACPRPSRFGDVPATDDALLQVFLGGAPFVITGPPAWNALGLGATALHADTLVYNTKRTGTFHLGGRRFRLRRVAFPRHPSPEWYALDLLRNTGEAGVSHRETALAIARAVRLGRLDAARLRAMARRYARTSVRRLVDGLDSPEAGPVPAGARHPAARTP